MDSSQKLEPQYFIDNTDALVSLCKSVLDELLKSLNEEGQKVNQAQLIEVSRSIDQLTKLGISIPDELRNLKLSLIAEIENKGKMKEKFGTLLTGLKTTISSSESAFLSIFPGKKQSRKRRTKSDPPITNQDDFRVEIIDALKILGGSGSINEVMEIIEERMKDKLLPGDFEKRSRGNLVWKNNVQWARNSLREEGIILSGTPRGIWELSEEYK
jgi:hypothetical protein